MFNIDSSVISFPLHFEAKNMTAYSIKTVFFAFFASILITSMEMGVLRAFAFKDKSMEKERISTSTSQKTRKTES